MLRADASRAERCLQSNALILQHGAWAASLTLAKKSQHPPEQVGAYWHDSPAARGCPQTKM